MFRRIPIKKECSHSLTTGKGKAKAFSQKLIPCTLEQKPSFQRNRENFLTKLHPCPSGITQQITLLSKAEQHAHYQVSLPGVQVVSGADKTTLVREERELTKSSFVFSRLRCATEKPMDTQLSGFHPWLASNPSLLSAKMLPANCFTGHWAVSHSIRKQNSANTCYLKCFPPT